MPIDPSRFKQTLASFAAGVTVVTTEMAGERGGITVSAFSSLSLAPPLILVCIDRKSRLHDAIAAAGKFAVNVLGSDQQEISNRFASRSDDKFAGIATHTGALGLPLIDGAIATLECEVKDGLAGGDHTIYVGEVMATEVAEGEPLLYFRGGYRTIA